MKKLVLNLLVGFTIGNASFAQVVPPVKSQPVKIKSHRLPASLVIHQQLKIAN